jgi:hypothetical protein
MGGGWKVFGATHVRLGWSAIEQTYLSPMTGWGHEQTTRTRQSGVCLYSVNRPQSRRKQTLAPVFPRQDLPRRLALAPGPSPAGADSFPKLPSNKLICRPEGAKPDCAGRIWL